MTRPIDHEEYRIGCWTGKLDDGMLKMKHDSSDSWIEIDECEAHDFESLVVILHLKDEIQSGDSNEFGMFNKMFRNLEAKP